MSLGGTNAINLIGGSSPDPIVREYISSGTWTKPSGLKKLMVLIVGAGGGGASGAATAGPTTGGVAGFGGYRLEIELDASVLPSTASITIGTGGGGGLGVKNTNIANIGSSGGSSFFDTYEAKGGDGGNTSTSLNVSSLFTKNSFRCADGGIGGVGSTSSPTAGANGGGMYLNSTTLEYAAIGGATHNNGNNGYDDIFKFWGSTYGIGTGGSGGGGSSTTPGYGGNGGRCCGGGGGAGVMSSTIYSGKGGNGGNGLVILVEFY